MLFLYIYIFLILFKFSFFILLLSFNLLNSIFNCIYLENLYNIKIECKMQRIRMGEIPLIFFYLDKKLNIYVFNPDFRSNFFKRNGKLTRLYIYFYIYTLSLYYFFYFIFDNILEECLNIFRKMF